jgi:hypothetical protein
VGTGWFGGWGTKQLQPGKRTRHHHLLQSSARKAKIAPWRLGNTKVGHFKLTERRKIRVQERGCGRRPSLGQGWRLTEYILITRGFGSQNEGVRPFGGRVWRRVLLSNGRIRVVSWAASAGLGDQGSVNAPSSDARNPSDEKAAPASSPVRAGSPPHSHPFCGRW